MGPKTHPRRTELLLTVSGGLEDFAERQIRSLLRNWVGNDDDSASLQWHHRGPSGSQLTLLLMHREEDQADMERIILKLMKGLNYVDYVFVLLESLKLETNNAIGVGSSNHHCEEEESSSLTSSERLLEQVEKASENMISSSEKIESCRRICDALASGNDHNEDTVGFDNMPGLLLPTLDIDTTSPNIAEEIEGCHLPTNMTNMNLDINTIYTKDIVARAVVQRMVEFCRQHNPQHDEATSLWIDAGSGNGALLRHLPENNSIGIDTHPTATSQNRHRVLKMDFLKVSKEWLIKEELLSKQSHVYVISNPPFAISSRGDYTPIVQFINHSLEVLGAELVAVICPSRFANTRIWRSLDLTPRTTLVARWFLPQNAFLDPSNQKSVHIHSCCLLFGNQPRERSRSDNEKNENPTDTTETHSKSGVYLSSKRDKSLFPNLSTANLTSAIASGLTNAGVVELVAERKAKYRLSGKLVDASRLQFWWQLNPQKPCSLVNSTCFRVPNHSLGWLSLSCKPPVALAMSSAALPQHCSQQQEKVGSGNPTDSTKPNSSCVAINLMSGEGTIELESNRASQEPFFWISGDKNFERARKTAERMRSIRGSEQSSRHHLVDMVVWDAQRLPLRKGIADAVLADLPFQGSLQKAHREAVVGGKSSSTPSSVVSLDYSQVFQDACRVLRPNGRAALLSPDVNALKHASGKLHWSPLLGYNNSSKSINLGGLSGKLMLMERRKGCTKDVSMWVSSSSTKDNDWSSWILGLANEACYTTRNTMNGQLDPNQVRGPLVTRVRLHSTFYHERKQCLSHCYRMFFHDEIKNIQVKQLEQQIRQMLQENLKEGMSLR